MVGIHGQWKKYVIFDYNNTYAEGCTKRRQVCNDEPKPLVCLVTYDLKEHLKDKEHSLCTDSLKE